MLVEAFSLVLQLPPLAFGPVRPPDLYVLPKELVCPVQELGRIRTPQQHWSRPPGDLDPRRLQPPAETFLVNRPVDLLLFLSLAYAGKATWDTAPWAARAWQATGAVTPVLIPPMAPPSWARGR